MDWTEPQVKGHMEPDYTSLIKLSCQDHSFLTTLTVSNKKSHQRSNFETHKDYLFQQTLNLTSYFTSLGCCKIASKNCHSRERQRERKWGEERYLGQYLWIVYLQVMKEKGVKNIIFSSSATVYGSPQYLPIDEKHPVGGCTNPYGKTKFFIEEILRDLHKAEPVSIFNRYSVIRIKWIFFHGYAVNDILVFFFMLVQFY